MFFFSQKWHFKASTAKSEEKGLCLKLNFTLSRVSQKNVGGLLLPYLETGIFKNQIFPISWGFATTFQHHTDKEVLNSLTVCLGLFLKLDHGSGQVCVVVNFSKLSRDSSILPRHGTESSYSASYWWNLFWGCLWLADIIPSLCLCLSWHSDTCHSHCFRGKLETEMTDCICCSDQDLFLSP